MVRTRLPFLLSEPPAQQSARRFPSLFGFNFSQRSVERPRAELRIMGWLRFRMNAIHHNVNVKVFGVRMRT